MGTRGVYGYKFEGKEHLIWHHFDSYPRALGSEIVNYVRKYDVDEMRKMVKELEFVDDQDDVPRGVKTKYRKFRGDDGSTWRAVLWKATNEPQSLRGKIPSLEYFHNEIKHFPEHTDSIMGSNVSIMIEWKYLIDLDERQLLAQGWGIDLAFPLDNIPEDWRYLLYQNAKDNRNKYGIDFNKDDYTGPIFGTYRCKSCRRTLYPNIEFDRVEDGKPVFKCEYCEKEYDATWEQLDK